MKKLQYSNSFFLMLVLLSCFCLSGCGEKTQLNAGEEEWQETSGASLSVVQTKEQAELRGSYVVKELNFPDPDLCLLELQGEGQKLSLSEFELINGIIYRELWIYDAETYATQGAYIQKLEPPYESWTVTVMPYLFSDGEKEYGVGDHVFCQGIPTFCRLYGSDDDSCYWASCDENGAVNGELYKIPERLKDYTFTVSKTGMIYAYVESGTELFCLNESMEIVKEIKLPKRIDGVISDALGEKVYWYGHDEDNFGIYDLSGEVIVPVSEKLHILWAQAAMDIEGEIYVANSEKLWLDGKELKLLCDFTLCDYPWGELYGMEVQEDGSLLLFGELDGDYCLARAVEEEEVKQQEKQEIVIAFGENHKAMLKSISRFNRQSNKYHISAMLREKDVNWLDYDRKIQMEISAGRGPDIISDDLVVDISSYLENGYFASLEGVLDDESAYLQAALEGGRAEGVLYGMPYDFEMQFVTYSKDFAKDRTSWTLSELMEAVEKSDAEILQYGYDGVDIVMWYGLYDNDNKAYIDWEKGESHLTEEPFLELLAFAEKYADKDKGKEQREKEGEMLLAGRALATDDIMRSFEDLYGLDACFAGNPAPLGFPRTEGNGIYARSRYLYVNSSSACKEGAIAFLQFLLSEEEQSKYMICEYGMDGWYGYVPNFPVNLNAFKKLVTYSIHKKSGDVTRISDERGMEGYKVGALTEKQEEQVNFMLERVRPDNWYARNIQDIVSEELEPYFAGEKKAEQVSEILNRRVQLYLDERK